MKRILHIIDNFGQGAGAEHVLLGILNNLEGYDNYLLYFNKPDGLINKLTVPVNTIYYPVVNKLDLVKAAYFLKKVIQDNNIDIVHAHLTQSIIITKFARIKSIPVFITYHSILFQKYKWGILPTLPYLAHLLSYKKNQISIGVSNAVLVELQKRFGVKEKMYCIYNFVDNIFFEQQPAKIIEKKIFKIICVGNIRPEKNFDLHSYRRPSGFRWLASFSFGVHCLNSLICKSDYAFQVWNKLRYLIAFSLCLQNT